MRKIIRFLKKLWWKWRREPVKEEMGLQDGWYEEAKEMTPEKLPAFIDKLTLHYNHDYGTICYAIAAAAVAAAWAVNNSGQGGITGFQAGCIKWEFIKNWQTEYKDKPLRLLDYSKLLYPQHDDKFNTISLGAWEWLQEEAQNKLDESEPYVVEAVRQRWKDIAIHGEVPAGMKLEEE
ncbi:MAG: hypothetical protein ACOC4Y_01930 [bacterium]